MTAVADQTLVVSIVEDDEDIRSNLVRLISKSSGFRLAGEYASAEEALKEIPAAVPQVLLMDINLPGMDGIECVRRLKSDFPQLQIVMLTVYEDGDQIFQSLRAGASGYLLKRTPRNKILESLRDVCSGGSPMNSHIARKVVQFFNQLSQPDAELATLSSREREVLDHLSRGEMYKEIADKLQISLDTVRKHLQSIYQKLHVHSRTAAVLRYLQK